MNNIENFIENMANGRSFINTRNLYSGTDRITQIRKNNLTIYLIKMLKENPSVILLGEAPGYKGCGHTGIAFTSEKIIQSKSFFENESFLIESKSKFEGEISATIVWNEIEKTKPIPLLWNIFPYHPYKESNYQSNRTPNTEELDFGKNILNQLLIIFDIKKIIAVGRKAELKLNELNLEHKYLRHPANGGKNQFVQGYRKLNK